jgi:hypothetical protein
VRKKNALHHTTIRLRLRIVLASKTIMIDIGAAAVEFANFSVEFSLDVAAEECANLYRDTNRTIYESESS